MKLPYPVIPFGACTIASVLRAKGHQVRVLDLCFIKNEKEAIEKTIQSFPPDAVGVSIRNIDDGSALNTNFFLETIRQRIILPLQSLFSGPLIIGGPAVNINPREILDFFNVPYASYGDGEEVAINFIEALAEKRPLNTVTGLITRENGPSSDRLPEHSPCRINSFNLYPLPKIHEFLDLTEYEKIDSYLPVQTKRGCALSCVYCSYNSIEGHQYRLRDPEEIAEHISNIHTQTKWDKFEFTDSVFNIPLSHAKNVLRAIIKKNLPLRLRTMGLNPSAVDKELVDLMKQAGFIEIDLGVESACDQTLNGLGKNFKVQDIHKAGKLLQENNIPVNWFLMFGAPNETVDTLQTTINNISKWAKYWDFICTGIGIRVYHQTPLSRQIKSNDNFLRPVGLDPSSISLKEMELEVLIASAFCPNFYVFGPRQSVPPYFITRQLIAMWKKFAPQLPNWRLVIILQQIEIWSGLRLLRMIRWRNELKKMRRDKKERPIAA